MSVYCLQLSDLKVIRAGFEPTTHSLEGCCSIQLSYRTILFAFSECKDSIFWLKQKTFSEKFSQSNVIG